MENYWRRSETVMCSSSQSGVIKGDKMPEKIYMFLPHTALQPFILSLR